MIKNPETEALCQRIAKIKHRSRVEANAEMHKWIDLNTPKRWEMLAIIDRINVIEKEL